ncbi:hypothetical protein B0J12DRAFT_668301 [Macrophomina phaseolina]|uniref:Secreted protein n=1 Tax=Macrophomina phaseolina TaxID=35725 RepID=A0ABQ8G712_9PEZI|nr:hypothetical protein B0J12DRAFT_668301 [Macrophomina phaseolina]
MAHCAGVVCVVMSLLRVLQQGMSICIAVLLGHFTARACRIAIFFTSILCSKRGNVQDLPSRGKHPSSSPMVSCKTAKKMTLPRTGLNCQPPDCFGDP